MDTRRILNSLRGERDRIDQAIMALAQLAPHRPPNPPKSTPVPAPLPQRASMGLAARKHLSEMMKKRWAEQKRATRKRKPMSAAARKKLSALMKARWAEGKKSQSA